MKKIRSCLFAAALVLATVPTAWSAETLSVRSVFASRAEGSNGQPPVSIEVWPGYGTNLNLIPTGETIKKAWIDDPSRVAVDFDTDLCSGTSSQDGGGKCSGGATVVHLRQIQGLKFPGLTTAPNTLLTLVTEGAGGRRLYQFQVVPASGKPEYHTLTIMPDSRGTPFIELASSRRATLEDVQRGLELATAGELVRRGEPLWGKVQNFIARVRNGDSIPGAAQSAGVSMSLVSKLAEQGSQPQPLPQPSPPEQVPAEQQEPVSQAPKDSPEQQPQAVPQQSTTSEEGHASSTQIEPAREVTAPSAPSPPPSPPKQEPKPKLPQPTAPEQVPIRQEQELVLSPPPIPAKQVLAKQESKVVRQVRSSPSVSRTQNSSKRALEPVLLPND